MQAAGWEIYEAIFFKYCRINYLPGANWVKGLPSHPYIQRQMQTQLRKYKQGKKSRALHHIPPVGTIWVNWDKYNKNANTKTEAKTKKHSIFCFIRYLLLYFPFQLILQLLLLGRTLNGLFSMLFSALFFTIDPCRSKSSFSFLATYS